jgi:hypothetical protein
MNFWDIINNLIASFIWALLVVVVLRFKTIQLIVARLAPKVGARVPHIDFIVEYQSERSQRCKVIIQNAGSEPAYNVYVYLFEEPQVGEGIMLLSLGNEGISKGILGAGKQIIFDDKKVAHESCNVTTAQQIWVEFSNAAGVHFRSIVIPPSARGDDWKILPPKVIRVRLPTVPYWRYEEKDPRSIGAIKKGRVSLS